MTAVENGADSGLGETMQFTHRQVMTVLGGMLIALFLSALDSTIVSTALPTMAGDLGSVDQLPWVLSAYLLTSTAATPLWGKFSDLWGRREMFQAAIIWYLVASVLTGVSQNMIQLVVGRAMQGIGGGGIAALTFVIIGDLISPRERGRYMGWFTGTYTSAALIGPLVGGFLVDSAHWRWIFYVKIPFALVALVMVSRVLKFPFTRTRRRVDVEGAGLLVTSVTALILLMSWGGDRMPWTSGTIIGLAALFVVTAGAFVWQERRAVEPMIPPRIFRSRIVTLAILMSLAAGAAMMSANAFVPLFLQVVSGTSATASGLALAPLMIMLTIGSILAGNLMTRSGRYKRFIVVGPLLAVVGVLGLANVDTGTTATDLVPWLVLLGVGMGFVMPTATTIAQNALPPKDLGVGTATLTFARNLGGTIGVGAYGAALSARMDGVIASAPARVRTVSADELLSTPSDIQLLPDQLRELVIQAVAEGTVAVFTIAVPIALLVLVCGALIPEVPLRTWSQGPALDTEQRPSSDDGDLRAAALDATTAGQSTSPSPGTTTRWRSRALD